MRKWRFKFIFALSWHLFKFCRVAWKISGPTLPMYILCGFNFVKKTLQIFMWIGFLGRPILKYLAWFFHKKISYAWISYVLSAIDIKEIRHFHVFDRRSLTFFSSIYDSIQTSQVKNWLTVLMLRYFLILIKTYHCWKMSKYGVISGLYFPVFGLNTEIYGVNLRIQSEYRKIRTINNTVLGLISRRVLVLKFRSYIDEIKKLHCLCNYLWCHIFFKHPKSYLNFFSFRQD